MYDVCVCLDGYYVHRYRYFMSTMENQSAEVILNVVRKKGLVKAFQRLYYIITHVAQSSLSCFYFGIVRKKRKTYYRIEIGRENK